MTNTLTQRVAEALWDCEASYEPIGRYWGISWKQVNEETEGNHRIDAAKKLAKAAIEVSGAQHLQRLVEALKCIATGKNSNGEKVDFFQDIAKEALAALPPELRGK